MSKKKFHLRTDEKMNPQLKQEVQGVRDIIWNAMPQIEADHFVISQCLDRPAVLIMDTRTQRVSNPIGLCNLRGAIQIINELKL